MNNNKTIPDFVSEIIEVGTGDFNDIPGYRLCEIISYGNSSRRTATYKKEK